MKDIRLVELNANEQETLQGGGYGAPGFYNVPQNNNIADSSATSSQAQGQQAQQQSLLDQVKGVLF